MNDVATLGPDVRVPAPEEQIVTADIKLLSGRMVRVQFPPTMTDDDLCVLVMEITKNLRVSARKAAQGQAKARIVVARSIPG